MPRKVDCSDARWFESWGITDSDTPYKGRLVRHSMFDHYGIGIIKAEVEFRSVVDKGEYYTGFLASFPMVGDVAVRPSHLLWLGGPPDQTPEKAPSER